MASMQSLVALAQTWAYSTAARPIFVAMIKGYVMIILNHMLSCFRSKNWFAWRIFNKIDHHCIFLFFWPDVAVFLFLHYQSLLLG